MHPRLSIDAMCTFKWSFDQDLALWTDLGIRHAGLLGNKLADAPEAKMAQLDAAGIRDEWDAVMHRFSGGYRLGPPAHEHRCSWVARFVVNLTQGRSKEASCDVHD